jgi:hypothetical protein
MVTTSSSPTAKHLARTRALEDREVKPIQASQRKEKSTNERRHELDDRTRLNH